MTKPKNEITDFINSFEPVYQNVTDGVSPLGKFLYSRMNEHVALNYELAFKEGDVASLPLLVGALSKTWPDNKPWRFVTSGNSLATLSQEVVFKDKQGRFGRKNTYQLLTMHGKLLLPPEQLYNMHNLNRVASLPEEFLPKKDIPIYTVPQVKNQEVENPFGIYGVILRYEEAIKHSTDNSMETRPIISLDDYVNNPLVLARTGTPRYLKDFYWKCRTIMSGSANSCYIGVLRSAKLSNFPTTTLTFSGYAGIGLTDLKESCAHVAGRKS